MFIYYIFMYYIIFIIFKYIILYLYLVMNQKFTFYYFLGFLLSDKSKHSIIRISKLIIDFINLLFIN